MSKVDEKLPRKKHNHKKAHDTNSSRNRKRIREMKRGWCN
ncbi:hypothetical protein HOR54_gp22 [Vibrio phage Vp670]|uniref:Uncharacterized protein n=1 Tax=Vibrio phage Vp670 TaxID=1932890 RepID=A0A1L7DPV5_9CAUD|nr:hypothetical protein HOR54_gp22 [Vibrio phage Vp670]APU00159.1 hypothetical protein QD07_22 [Vibrio phage Vp670]